MTFGKVLRQAIQGPDSTEQYCNKEGIQGVQKKMSHRFDYELGYVTPKPSARERTKYRFRMRNGLDTKQDEVRFDEHKGILTKIKEKLLWEKENERI